ncbi:YcgL domain-containing protein [Zophobihabitans entericus]|uniref:YcgL domain-containing protein IPMB12_08750 n=1 Tax=Zophobihabitans entericus TaxID=1635327 RepID=A0A6G9ID63_9GAMM|nr:YcgL domain-containing protein [Zophobihabitans entericus]QIQ21762.1 YcgL domain-containing protein [Zophobihabitans entericus]
MWCFIYRSTKKMGSYLYIEKENDFSPVPEELMKLFGKPVFAMKLYLDDARKLAAATPQEIKQKMAEQGYFLQMLREDDFKI